MKRMIFIGIVLSIIVLAGVSYAGVAQISPILFADQDMPVGFCGVYSPISNPAPLEVLCVDCNLAQFDSLTDGAWCGDEVKWDTGVETATGMVVTVTQTKKYNPIPGKFPYKGPFINGNGFENFNECHTTFSDCVPAADACVSGASGPIAVAIHADIFKSDDEEMTETAWAAECLQFGPDGIFRCQEWGTDFAGKNWATYVHVPCNTGLPLDCDPGFLSCNDGVTECKSIRDEPEVCNDGLDNDCDGSTDCDDSDCDIDLACGPLCNENGFCTVFMTSIANFTGDLVTRAISLGLSPIDGLDAGDQICQKLADDAGIGGVYKAWLSDSTESVADRFLKAAVPYLRVDGVRVADNWVDLTDGSIQATITVFENGGFPVSGAWSPWTGTEADGSEDGESRFCNDWTSSSVADQGFSGRWANTNEQWTASGPRQCNRQRAPDNTRIDNTPILCFEQ